MKNQIKFRKILTILLILLMFTLFSCKSNDKPTKNTPSKTENSFELKLIEDQLFLLNAEKTIKKYEINPKVLPSEDILLLIEGIKVKDEEEADLLAENFDG